MKKALNSDLKQFHKQQAQQYKDYIKRSEVSKYHDQSQSTLMDATLVDENRDDQSADLRPAHVHQGTQPSEIMMQSLEEKL